MRNSSDRWSREYDTWYSGNILLYSIIVVLYEVYSMCGGWQCVRVAPCMHVLRSMNTPHFTPDSRVCVYVQPAYIGCAQHKNKRVSR